MILLISKFVVNHAICSKSPMNSLSHARFLLYRVLIHFHLILTPLIQYFFHYYPSYL